MQTKIERPDSSEKVEIFGQARHLTPLLLRSTSVVLTGIVIGILANFFVYSISTPFVQTRFFNDWTFLVPVVIGIIFAIIVSGTNSAVYWLFTRNIKRDSLTISSIANDAQDSAALSASVQKRQNLKSSEILALDRLQVIESIHRRVERLTGRTQLFLYAMAAALVASAFIILFAGRLTSLDASAVSNIDRLKSDLVDENRKLSRLYALQNLYTQLQTAKGLNPPPPKETTDRLQQQIDILRGDFSSLDLNSTNQSIADEKSEIARVSKLLDEAWTTELHSERGYSDWHYITATAITRIGIVLIIIYLVQILMGLYRYNTRLIAYYNSRRDLLTLWDGKQRGLKALDEILTSSKIDFGREPKHPLEEFFKAMGNKANSFSSAKSLTTEKAAN